MRRTILFAVLLSQIGCTVGPNYTRPSVEVPDSFRQPYTPAARQSPLSLGDERWWEVFEDAQLQQLIRTALENNYDVRIAAAHVLESRALLGVARADEFPSLSGGADAVDQRGGAGQVSGRSTEITTSASWNLDFWGRYRRATEASRAAVLSSQWAQREVVATLIADVATDYFQLRALDEQLEASRRTLSARRESLELTQKLQRAGIDSLTDVREAEQLALSAAAEVADLERQVPQQENAISILLGRNPANVVRGLKVTEQPHAPDVPAGLPSSLLERRPDIREAEENLVAANARIGVARAAFFPAISLTGSGGLRSASLASLFSSPTSVWNVAASLAQPIFQAGRLRNNVRLAETEREEMLLTYQQVIQSALRDVSDSLVAYQKNREFRIQQEHLLESSSDAARLSRIRFKAGLSPYLEVLTNESAAFSAELTLSQARANELIALAQLYRDLGGGWE